MPSPNLDSESASHLNQLLDQALELPATERLAWVSQLPAAHDALKPHLRDLLSRTGQIESADFLGSLPHFAAPQDSPSPGGPLEPGMPIGPYRLLRELGRGGMGSVWLAERVDGQLNRQVALKLPHGAWPHARLAERLQRERDILATLEHPNIARLYDAGLAAEGQPYLALEYIEGQPIDEFCGIAGESPRLDVKTRVQLVLQVARAVAYAHGKLVLHRDLKPANILVTPDGAVRLLDFGIAKLLAEGQVHETRFTQVAGRALSPDYASPEQIRGDPLSVTSDIYSLGVVLFELLAGTRPYHLKRNSRGELEEAILFADPRRPSEAGAVADRRALRGDLDTIVLKALKKSAADRYPTAHALIDDLERHLDGRPVSARPDTVRYRAVKFVRRHRFAAVAGALLLVTLLAGTVGTTVGMVRARQAEAAARNEAATAERYATFLVNMFEATTPGQSKGGEISAREILNRGVTRIRKEFANEPLPQARLLATIGWAYTRQGLYSEARPIFDESVTLARGLGELGKADLAQALVRRGELERKLNEPLKAESDQREALAILEHAYGPTDVHLMPALAELGLLFSKTDPEQAIRFSRRSYDLLVAARGEADGDAAVLLQNIGSMQVRAHHYQDGKQALERALPHLKQHFGEQDPHVGAVLCNLSDVYRVLGEYESAVERAQSALEIDTAVSGAAHPDTGIDWLKLARSTDKIDNAQLALEQTERAAGIFSEHFPLAHPRRIETANAKAEFLIELGRLDDARKTLAEYAAAQAGNVESKRGLLNGQVILAGIERLQGQWPKSQAIAERVLADPATRGDPYLEVDARWARACALAMQVKSAEAETERDRAAKLESTSSHDTPFAGVLAHAKYRACAGEAAQAVSLLRAAVAQGYRDPLILHDPALAELRQRADFVPIAAAFADPHRAAR
jgi:serine/threonine protein kinase/tetratricopeptide (TPR) repeat protein